MLPRSYSCALVFISLGSRRTTCRMSSRRNSHHAFARAEFLPREPLLGRGPWSAIYHVLHPASVPGTMRRLPAPPLSV